ncbi:hypothetical protein DFJ73DRAFT_947925 [Zopfochytrium polystomum]|nr:hypothetical protein DFJ73DRAFT_947925 [Zopfochytrium polystomum]
MKPPASSSTSTSSTASTCTTTSSSSSSSSSFSSLDALLVEAAAAAAAASGSPSSVFPALHRARRLLDALSASVNLVASLPPPLALRDIILPYLVRDAGVVADRAGGGGDQSLCAPSSSYSSSSPSGLATLARCICASFDKSHRNKVCRAWHGIFDNPDVWRAVYEELSPHQQGGLGTTATMQDLPPPVHAEQSPSWKSRVQRIVRLHSNWRTLNGNCYQLEFPLHSFRADRPLFKLVSDGHPDSLALYDGTRKWTVIASHRDASEVWIAHVSSSPPLSTPQTPQFTASDVRRHEAGAVISAIDAHGAKRLLAVGTYDRRILLSHLDTCETLAVLSPHLNAVRDLAFLPADDRTGPAELVSVGLDRRIAVSSVPAADAAPAVSVRAGVVGATVAPTSSLAQVLVVTRPHPPGAHPLPRDAVLTVSGHDVAAGGQRATLWRLQRRGRMTHRRSMADGGSPPFPFAPSASFTIPARLAGTRTVQGAAWMRFDSENSGEPWSLVLHLGGPGLRPLRMVVPDSVARDDDYEDGDEDGDNSGAGAMTLSSVAGPAPTTTAATISIADDAVHPADASHVTPPVSSLRTALLGWRHHGGVAERLAVGVDAPATAKKGGGVCVVGVATGHVVHREDGKGGGRGGAAGRKVVWVGAVAGAMAVVDATGWVRFWFADAA